MASAFLTRRGGGSVNVVKNSTATFNYTGTLNTLRSSRKPFTYCTVNGATPEIGDLFICDGEYAGIIMFFGENRGQTTGAAYLINTTADSISLANSTTYTGTLYRGIGFPAFYTAT